jgi:hypothetical protein
VVSLLPCAGLVGDASTALLLLLLLWNHPSTEIITIVITSFKELPASQLRYIIIRQDLM